MRFSILLPLILAGCSGAAGAPSKPPIAPAPAPTATSKAPVPTAKTQRTYTLTLPERWTRQAGNDFETITGPEGAVKLHIWETTGTDLEAVIAGGWKKIAPAMALKERTRSTGAGNERFSERLVVTYTDDENERMAQAIALRHVKETSRVYLVLVQGPLKTVQKRGAELGRILTSIEVEGAARLEVKAADRKPFDAARQKAFFEFVDEARQMAGVPGSAVAVVTPEGVFTRGFGARTAGKPEPVGPDTQLMLGSITKSFSTLLLATLVDDGKMAWDTPVKKVYPSFALGDARSDEVQVQHLFCACVGAPRQDMELLFEFANKKPADVFGEIAKMKLTTGFGETFQYNNQLTAAGGYIAGHVAMGGGEVGAAYAKALRQRVLDPIGMKDTTVLEAKVRARNNFAMPHRLDWSNKTETLDLSMERFVRPYAPAGALWSTANDMAKYLQLQLASGKRGDGKPIVSERNLRRTQTAQIEVSARHGYGMGWLIGKYRGLKAVEHSGGTMGFNSDLVFFPEIGVGLFIVGNRSPAMMNGAVRARLFEVLFELSPKIKQKLAHNLAEAKRIRGESSKKVTALPIPNELLGRYESTTLGTITIRRRGKNVELDAGEWRAGLAVLDPKERKDALVMTGGVMQGGIFFQQEIEGKPALVLKHSQTDYVFRKK